MIGGQNPRPESERGLSMEAVLAIDLQRAKERAQMVPACYIVQALSGLIGAHLAVTKGASTEAVHAAEKQAAEYIAKALAR